MNVNIKKLNENAVIPKYAKPGDSGFDLVAISNVIVRPGQTVKVPIGLAFEIPTGYELQIRPRSGISSRTNLRTILGTVDSGYRGEVAVTVDNINQKNDNLHNGLLTIENEFIFTTEEQRSGTYVIKKGDKIAQGVIAPVIQAVFTEVDTLSETERGEGGFGHTGYNFDFYMIES